MESDGRSDVDVLDDLLSDEGGEGDTFEDAEAFFDADIDHDGDEGLEDMTTDNILSQLDAVTTLDGDDDDVQGDNGDQFHDLASVPSSPELADVTKSTNKNSSAAVEESSGQISQMSPTSGNVVVQAVLDLATNVDDEEANEVGEQESKEEHETKETMPTQKQQVVLSLQNNIHDEKELPSGTVKSESPAEIVTNEDKGDTMADGERDAVVITTPSIDEAEHMEDASPPIEPGDMPPIPPTHDTNTGDVDVPLDSIVLPPPAPTTLPVMVGSMNPVEDDNDDSDDSEVEEENKKDAPLPPPLQLNNPEDDDEDVLEVDAAVVNSLEIEHQQRSSKRVSPTGLEPVATKKTDESSDNALFKALPTAKAKDTSAIDLSFAEEVRVAHVTTLEPSSPFSDIHKMAGGPHSNKPSADATFGISYQSIRKKPDEPPTDENEGGYSLPSGPAFPDEREFENEMELTSDLSFSVARTAGISPSKAATTADDDEFVFDLKPEGNPRTLSEDDLRARRESLEAQKRKEEEELLKELKHATDREKKIIENNKAMESGQSISSATGSSEVAAEPDALSLTELHSIYKRGLGDQEVLMDDEGELETKRATEVGRSMSVMGRIFSPTQETTETIAEEDDDNEDEGNTDNKKGVNPFNTIGDGDGDDAKAKESDVDESAEWKEIKLIQHRQSREESGTAARTSNNPEAALVSSVSYADAAGYYAETPDAMQHREIIVSEDFPRSSCLTCLSRPKLAFAGAIEERDRVFCIAATAFDPHNTVVVGMLQTIYQKITRTQRGVPLTGRHWEDIGFQGSDPSTDLRGCGVLSLLQMLYFVETYPDLAHRFHELSQHPTRHFPFACALINITLQCVVALRSGALYPECNKYASVLAGMNRLYVALASRLHDAIQSRPEEIPLILKDVLDRGRSSPNKVIADAFDGSTLRPSRPAAAVGPSKSKASERKESDNNLEFTEIGQHAVDDE